VEEFRCAHVQQALPLFERALADARAARHPMMLGHALINLGEIVFQFGEPGRAGELYQQGLAQFERDVWGSAFCHTPPRRCAQARRRARAGGPALGRCGSATSATWRGLGLRSASELHATRSASGSAPSLTRQLTRGRIRPYRAWSGRK